MPNMKGNKSELLVRFAGTPCMSFCFRSIVIGRLIIFFFRFWARGSSRPRRWWGPGTTASTRRSPKGQWRNRRTGPKKKSFRKRIDHQENHRANKSIIHRPPPRTSIPQYFILISTEPLYRTLILYYHTRVGDVCVCLFGEYLDEFRFDANSILVTQILKLKILNSTFCWVVENNKSLYIFLYLVRGTKMLLKIN